VRAVILGLVLTLAGLASAAETSFSFMVNSVTGQVLPAGKYFWIHVENGIPVVTEIVTRPLTNDPDDPPPDNLNKQVTALLEKVTLDTEKKTTAGKLAGLCDLLLAQIEAGTVKDVATLRKDVGAVVPVLTLMGKAPAWKPFTDGVTAMMANTDFAASVIILKAVTVALKTV
jgi:hypothetical protein